MASAAAFAPSIDGNEGARALAALVRDFGEAILHQRAGRGAPGFEIGGKGIEGRSVQHHANSLEEGRF
jgi:hypothetical protein